MTGWLLYSLSYGLLVGRQEGPDEPPLGLCITQTLLIYAVPVLSVNLVSLESTLRIDYHILGSQPVYFAIISK